MKSNVVNDENCVNIYFSLWHTHSGSGVPAGLEFNLDYLINRGSRVVNSYVLGGSRNCSVRRSYL